MRPPSQGTKPFQAHYLSVCCVLRAQVQFCWFDKADATADVQWHCNHGLPHWYHFFQLKAHWVQISWSTGLAKSFGLVPPVGEPARPGTPLMSKNRARLFKTNDILLVNLSLNFQWLISQYANIFSWKNVRNFCSAKASLIFSTKNFSVFGYEVVKHLTSWPLNELGKLTMLWTTGPVAVVFPFS